MDEEAKQLLREIRDAVLRNEERYQKVTAESFAADANWKEEIRSNLRRAEKGRRIIAGIICVGVILSALVWLISLMGPTSKEKSDDFTEIFPGVRVKRDASKDATTQDRQAVP